MAALPCSVQSIRTSLVCLIYRSPNVVDPAVVDTPPLRPFTATFAAPLYPSASASLYPAAWDYCILLSLDPPYPAIHGALAPRLCSLYPCLHPSILALLRPYISVSIYPLIISLPLAPLPLAYVALTCLPLPYAHSNRPLGWQGCTTKLRSSPCFSAST